MERTPGYEAASSDRIVSGSGSSIGSSSRVGAVFDKIDGQSGTRIARRSVMVAGHRTSVSLEDAFWRSLKTIAITEDLSLNALVTEVDSRRSGNLSSALRVFALEWLMRQQKLA